jgi:hypothetical protein
MLIVSYIGLNKFKKKKKLNVYIREKKEQFWFFHTDKELLELDGKGMPDSDENFFEITSWTTWRFEINP